MQWKGRGGKQISEAEGRQMGTNNEVNGVNEVVSGGGESTLPLRSKFIGKAVKGKKKRGSTHAEGEGSNAV